MGCDGCREGGNGFLGTVLRGRARPARHHRQCDQPWCDRRQRGEPSAQRGISGDPSLARERLDADAPRWHAGGYRERGHVVVHGRSELHQRTDDPRRRWRIHHGSGLPARNSAGLRTPAGRAAYVYRYSSVTRPLRYSINVTLDGCCDHRAMVADEELHRHAVENLNRADALLFGRVTYEMMESAFRLPAQTETRPDWMEPFARTIDAAKKYVVSSTL